MTTPHLSSTIIREELDVVVNLIFQATVSG